MSVAHVDVRLCASSAVLASVCYFSIQRLDELCVPSRDGSKSCFPHLSSLTVLGYLSAFGALRYGLLPRFKKVYNSLAIVGTFWAIPLMAFHYLVVTRQAAPEWVDPPEGGMSSLATYILMFSIAIYFFNIWSAPEIVGAISISFVILSFLQFLASLWVSLDVIFDYSIACFGIYCCMKGLTCFLRGPEGSRHSHNVAIAGLRTIHWYYLLLSLGVYCIQYSLHDIFLAQNAAVPTAINSNLTLDHPLAAEPTVLTSTFPSVPNVHQSNHPDLHPDASTKPVHTVPATDPPLNVPS